MLRFIKLLVIWPDPPIDPLTHQHTHPWVGVSLQIINLQTELNYLNYVKIYKIVSHVTWLTHWPTKPPTHPLMGGVSLQITNLQTELNYLDQVKTYSIVSHLTWPPPIDPLTHPTTHTPTHG